MMSKIFKPNSIKCKYFRYLEHYFTNISTNISLTYFVRLKSLGSPVEFKIKFHMSELSLAALHEFLLTEAELKILFRYR